MRSKIFNAIKVSALALALSFGMSYALAWTAPTVTPPGGNVAAPINTSITAQTKVGNLSIWDLVSNSLTTNALTIPGAVAGQVLTANAQGTAGWSNPAGGVGGEGNYNVHGMIATQVGASWKVPYGVTSVMVEVVGGGGGCGYPSPGAYNNGGSGGISSFGPVGGAPFVSATGGSGGTYSVTTSNGIGSGGTINGQVMDPIPGGPYGTNASATGYAYDGRGAITQNNGSCYSNFIAGGNGGYSQGIFSVTPHQAMALVAGAAGAAPASYPGGAGFAGGVLVIW